jgi:hypothetical protein
MSSPAGGLPPNNWGDSRGVNPSEIAGVYPTITGQQNLVPTKKFLLATYELSWAGKYCNPLQQH